MKKLVFISLLISLFLFSITESYGQAWTAKLDKDVRFYQPTDMGVLVAATEQSLYAIESATGATLRRRKDVRIDETDVARVPGTDPLLLGLEKGERTRIEALDVLT